ncbi:MAG: redox-sensing transcriptional repressor Rex [Sphaerochaetaceae bacterium]|jgi:redox-sensing transcriptional repressor|nr:redox-sensing transcriptional repressor Rex [Sphaerochaetaceae bacterium]
MQGISGQTIKRLPLYLTYLKTRKTDETYVSSTTISEDLRLNPVLVRKDLACVMTGKPKVGFLREDLIAALEEYLGYNRLDSAIIVGAGKLGRALLDYPGFDAYGIEVIAAFDISGDDRTSARPVLGIDKLDDIVKRMHIKIAILTVPAPNAQDVAKSLEASGIEAILNFAPVHLSLGESVIVKNVNLATELAGLAKSLAEAKEKSNEPKESRDH